MINIIKFELYKMSKKRSLRITMFFLALVIFVAGIYNFYYNNNENWKEELKNSNIRYEQQLKSTNKVSKNISDMLEQNIKLNSYYIANNINPNKTNLWGFMDKCSILTIIITIFSVIFSSSNIPKEIDTGTLNLLITKHYKRNKIFLGKLLNIIILISLLYIYIFIISFTVGVCLWGMKGINIHNIIVTSSGLEKIHIIESLSFKYLSYFITTLNFTILTFCISSMLNNSSVACIISTIILFCGTSLNLVFKKYSWYKYLYFVNLDISNYLGNYNQLINDLSFKATLTKHIIYMLIFILFSLYFFQNKELKCKN